MQSFLGLCRLNSDTQELPTEVKEEYLRRAILLMDRNPMVCVLQRNLSLFSSTMTFSIRMGPGPPAAISDLSSLEVQDVISSLCLPVYGLPIIVIHTICHGFVEIANIFPSPLLSMNKGRSMNLNRQFLMELA